MTGRHNLCPVHPRTCCPSTHACPIPIRCPSTYMLSIHTRLPTTHPHPLCAAQTVCFAGDTCPDILVVGDVAGHMHFLDFPPELHAQA